MKRLILLFVILLTVNGYAGWTQAGRISDEITVFDPRIITNGDTLHVVYWMWDGGSQSYYIKSTNNGNDWKDPFLMPDTSYTHNNVTPKVNSIGNMVIALWRSNIRGGPWMNFSIRRSTNCGQSWDDISYILPSNYYQLQKHAFSISDSIIYFIYSHSDNGIIFEFMKSSDRGGLKRLQLLQGAGLYPRA